MKDIRRCSITDVLCCDSLCPHLIQLQNSQLNFCTKSKLLLKCLKCLRTCILKKSKFNNVIPLHQCCKFVLHFFKFLLISSPVLHLVIRPDKNLHIVTHYPVLYLLPSYVGCDCIRKIFLLKAVMEIQIYCSEWWMDIDILGDTASCSSGAALHGHWERDHGYG